MSQHVTCMYYCNRLMVRAKQLSLQVKKAWYLKKVWKANKCTSSVPVLKYCTAFRAADFTVCTSLMMLRVWRKGGDTSSLNGPEVAIAVKYFENCFLKNSNSHNNDHHRQKPTMRKSLVSSFQKTGKAFSYDSTGIYWYAELEWTNIKMHTTNYSDTIKWNNLTLPGNV